MAFTFRFGKYQGMTIEEVPLDYLQWIVGEQTQMVNRAKQEIARREAVETASQTWVEKIVSAGFRSLAQKHHPDAGGDTATFQELQAAHEQLKAVLKELGELKTR